MRIYSWLGGTSKLFVVSVLLGVVQVEAAEFSRDKASPTHADVGYGPHEKNVMDVWLAESDTPTPVFVRIHGGGYYRGSKGVSNTMLRDCLDAGISVVAISYRYSSDAVGPAPLLDAARAVQFVRAQADEWNVDPQRIVAMGSSAGGHSSVWLALHDDLADPNSDDPVARQSSRLSGAIGFEAQTTYDPRTVRDWFPGFDVTAHPAIPRLLDIEGRDLQRLSPEQYAAYEASSAYPHASADDPPILLIYSRPIDAAITNTSIGIHHPRFGTELRDRLEPLGVSCTVLTEVEPQPQAMQFMRDVFGLEANQTGRDETTRR